MQIGECAGELEEPAVIEIACEFAVRRYFRSSINIAEIAAFVADMRGRVRSTSPPGQSETEAVIRLALGIGILLFRRYLHRRFHSSMGRL